MRWLVVAGCALVIALLLFAKTPWIHKEMASPARIATLEDLYHLLDGVEAYRAANGRIPPSGMISLHGALCSLPRAERERLSLWPAVPLRDGYGEVFIYKRIGGAPGEDYVLYSKGANRMDDQGEGDDVTGGKLDGP